MQMEWKLWEPLCQAAGQEAMRAWQARDRAALGWALLPKSIALVGFMGVGKTSVCAAMHTLLGLQAVETDQLIEQHAGITVPEIFDRYGEPHFRDLETAAVKEAAARPHTVISCGGGAVLRPENVAALQAGSCVVLLTATPQTILDRLVDDDTRPNLRGRKTVAGVQELMNKRAAAYQAAAQMTVVTDGKTLEEICREILTRMWASK